MAGLAAGAMPALALSDSAAPPAASLDQLTLADLRSSVRTEFEVSGPSGPLATLVLAKVEEQVHKRTRPHHPDAGNERFRLVFEGPLAPVLSQDTYTFSSARLGRFAMFIGPLQRKTEERCRYEAVFNRPPVERSTSRRS
jgi:hypothetical protein